MSARITSGTSWPGRRPGVRHWFSVSYYIHFWELGIGGIVLAPVIILGLLVAGEIWLVLEALVIIASGVLIAVNLATGMHLDWRNAHWQRLGFGLWALLVPERTER